MSTDITLPQRVKEPKAERKLKFQPPYHVVLLNDDDHTYEYVIRMLGQLFGYSEQKAYLIAREVDTTGRAIVDTTTRERAEFKRDQILAFGPDPLLPRSKGSMTAIVEPAENPGE
ncbi:MAG: Clp protease ClpS [Gemmataceae bacterium]